MSRLTEARNILVRATNWVGDAVMSLPALGELRRALPAARITLLARPWVSGVFERQGVADRVLPYPADGLRIGWRQTAVALRAERFDAALLLQNAFEAALLARWARIPVRCGYARDGRSWLLTEAVAVPRPGEIPPHECYYYLELLRRLGLLRELPQVDQIVLTNPPPRKAGRERLATFGVGSSHQRPVVGISPGAAFGTAKHWLPSRFAAVGRALEGDGAAIVLFGAASERALAETVAAAIGAGAISTAGRTTLSEFLDLVAGCDLFLTNDSGTMHLAAAAGVPVLAIFGATDEVATAPLGPRVRIVKKPVPCSPCKLRECPIDHRCMRGVQAEEVLAAAREMLQQAWSPAAVAPRSASVPAAGPGEGACRR